ncbi:MAG: D-alanine--D-alanine ligase [Chloroflexi bacterium]|nr:MAG: D-alanine--D-alanine ligase [Chloroflexota bacterium]TME14069.1 MAG: D-alanine--D-alanine ligase [Chloroflexota bacterium]
MKVAVLAGGRSSEREVSLHSGAQVEAALKRRGHEVSVLDVDREVWPRLAAGGFDCVFIALHGPIGEDGTVQGMLEVLEIPYTGCGVLASALCIDKAIANRLLEQAGLAIPAYQDHDVREGIPADLVDNLVAGLGLPLVVKPTRQGSTVGLTVARSGEEVADGLVLAGRYDYRVLAQRFVTGTEITVGVLATPDLQVLPTLEIVSENPVYDYDAKYTAGKSHHIIPARISEAARRRASVAAELAFRTLRCEGMARVDLIVDSEGVPWVLEVNTVPGLTELSLLPDAARAAGISFDELCDRLVHHARLRVGGKEA